LRVTSDGGAGERRGARAGLSCEGCAIAEVARGRGCG